MIQGFWTGQPQVDLHKQKQQFARISGLPPPTSRRSLSSMAALPRRTLGQTGLSVSILGFGASPLGGVFEVSAVLGSGAGAPEVQGSPTMVSGIGLGHRCKRCKAPPQMPQEIDEAEGVRAVHRAFAAGINYFDTSPFYGATRSEKVLGQALKDLPRSEIVVSSKVGRYGETTFDFSAARVTASVHESLQRLQIPYLDVVLCHDVENVDLAQVAKEAIPALVKLREAGLVKAVGFSGLPLKMFTKLLDLVEPGMVDVVLSWSHYTLADQSLLALMPQFQAKGLGVISASPLAMGLLTNRGPPAWHPAPDALKAACAAAAEHAKKRGVDISKLALMFALRGGDVSSTLVGMATSDLVDANVANARQALGLDPNPNAALEEEVMQEVEEMLKKCDGMTWLSGLPENN